MHTPNEIELEFSDDEPTAAPLVRLADLLSSARERRGEPASLRAAIARRFVFLRAATTRVSERVQSLTGQVESWVTRRDQVRDEVTTMAHVLRVRADLTTDEQRSFDQLVVDYTETTLGLLIDRDHATALTAVQRYLASVATTMPPSM